ncbi:aminotransferase class I/II-fold pyridoxal phosphate-dependent enzyme [Fulvivirgaceae bacterium BMA12]|uniref:Aminotransferase n=1 Tax=Agaribacillus aureus TaxID=3051825 RepID=A0ABT8L7Y9_9BACT|nr:aminotransferase class I/II-fold pyridoxal phosphate-dependent enzyme [Fulvivirgaceae bacterium BMA12]
MIVPQAHRLDNVKEYYFSKKLEEIRNMNSKGMDVINLGIGNPDLSPSQETIKALHDSSQQSKNHGYQSYRGIPALREAMARWYMRFYGVTLDPVSEILPLIGSKEGIMHISMAFLNPGDEVLVPNPGYPTYTSVSELVGARIRTYELDEDQSWSINLDQLKRDDLSRVKIMWINFPNMPTGARGSKSLFKELIALARQHKFLIVNDNPYSLILNDDPQSLLSMPGAEEVSLEMNSLSKSHNMAGWRMGWVSGRKDYIDTILKCKSNVDSGMFLPIQHAAIEAMKNPSSWHQEQNQAYVSRRNLSWQLLDQLGCTYDRSQTGLFIWAKIPASEPDLKTFVDKILMEAKVFITPGFIFGSKGARHVRISLCNKEAVITEALERIKRHITHIKVEEL